MLLHIPDRTQKISAPTPTSAKIMFRWRETQGQQGWTSLAVVLATALPVRTPAGAGRSHHGNQGSLRVVSEGRTWPVPLGCDNCCHSSSAC